MNSEKKIGQIIRQLRGNKSLREFAAQCGISHTALDAIECGYNKRTKKPTHPQATTLQSIANAAGVPLSYITGEVYTGSIKIPVLGKVAAGIPIEAITDIIDYEEIPAEMLKDGSEYFALEIQGDSMEPKISEGDVVIVRRQETCDNGDIAIVSINGDDATCKKVMIHEAGISLVPNNPAHQVMFFTREEIESTPIRIYGKVVELRAKF